MEPLKKQVDNLTLDVENRRVMRGFEEIAVSNASSTSSPTFVRHHGQTVTRQMFAKAVRREPHHATPLDNVIDVHVAHLRRKIDEGQRVKLLHTVRGVGLLLREEHPA